MNAPQKSLTERNYTHQKRTYKAQCVRLSASSVAMVQYLLEDAGCEVTPYGEQLMLRWPHRVAGLTIETMDIGDWVRKGENGVVKIMKDPEFQLKYEEAV